MTIGDVRIRDLELIVALHEEGNMTQAAIRLGITVWRPGPSHTLKVALEFARALCFG